MKLLHPIGRILALVLLSALFSAAAHAQATRTWVSGVGDDANPCSRTAPCKTFAGAISKTAAHGIINALDPAGYGAVNITKSITIDGTGTQASILASGTNGIIINAAATDNVIIRNVSIDGANTGLNGIRVLQAANVTVDNVFINRFTQKGIDVQPASTAMNLDITNSKITLAATGGINLLPGATGSVNASINNVDLERNSFGLQVNVRAKATVRDSTAVNNTTFGIGATGGAGTAVLAIDNTVASGNTGAGFSATSGGATVTLSRSATLNNGTGLSAALGGVIQSFGDNRNIGNNFPGGAPSSVPLQ